jgi:tetratricopeptide (TPR) repeat protein
MRLACLALLVSAVAQAQVAPDRELEVVKSMFNAGNYKLALERAQDAMGMANFTDAQRVELHKYAGVAAFNLGEAAVAERHFLQLLQINPDYVLDPFAVPPPAIKLFEEVKRKNSDALNLIRQNIALREEQQRREAAEALRRKQQEDAERDRLTRLSAQTKVIEKRPFIVNLVPFGVGQFVQGRTEWGIAFAVVEAVAAAVSIISFFAIESLFVEDPIQLQHALLPNGTFGPETIFVHRIPATQATSASVWTGLKWTSGILFYVVAATGIFDAIWHHKSDVVTTTSEGSKGPGVSLSITPLPGGAAGGLSLKF